MRGFGSEKRQALAIAAAVRQACLETVRRAYEEAGISGLCADGRWEYVMDALANLDLEAVLENTGR